MKTKSESENSLGRFIDTLKQFSQVKLSPGKNTLLHQLFNLFLPNLSSHEREDIQLEIQCLFTLSYPQDLSVKIRQLLPCPFFNATILPLIRELQAITCKLMENFRSIPTPGEPPQGSVLIWVHFSNSLPTICISRPA